MSADLHHRPCDVQLCCVATGAVRFGRPSHMRLPRLLILALAALVVLWGAYLIVVGLGVTIVPEDGTGPIVSRNIPDVRGWIPACAGTVVLLGELGGHRWLCWLGLAATTAFAALLLFSAGGPLVPVVVALAVALLLPTEARRSVSSP
jgi:hypothetical protein